MLGNFSATLSGVINLAIDAGIPEKVLARELSRFARMLQPQPRERMSIDPEADVCLVVPLMMKAACQSMGRGMRLPPELALGTPVS